MEKINVKKTVFDKRKDKPFTWKDIKDFKFEDDDVIRVEYVEPFYSENNSHDGYYNAEFIRMVEETDEQLQKRIEYNEREDKWVKERRYLSYLRLKKEFETYEELEDIEQAKEMEKEQQGYNEEEAYSIWQAGQNYGVTSGSSITFEELTKLLRNKKR